MKKARIIFLILPEVHLLDLAGPEQVFHEAIAAGAGIEVCYCASSNQLSTASGLRLTQLKKFSSLPIRSGDYVFIPGVRVESLLAASYPGEKEIARWLIDGYEKGASICSVCSGAFLLARIGLLNGKKATTHWKRTQQLQDRFPLIQVAGNILFTSQERIFTSAGVTAGIDLALHIITLLYNEELSFRIARELVVYLRRQGQDTQESIFTSYRRHLNAGVHAVQDHILDNIGRRITLSSLADVACTSSRNLTRVFKKETGITVNGYITLVRKGLLQKLAEEQGLSRKKMAGLCGLKSERQVIRLLKS